MLKNILFTFIVASSFCGLMPVIHSHAIHALDTVENAAMDPTDIPSPITRSNTKTVTIDLVAKEVIAALDTGVKFWFWAFAEKKGDTVGKVTVPGPMIRVMEGDTVVINLTNDMDNEEPHNIDFHAGFGAMIDDLEIGETGSLTFKAKKAGAYIYHCGAEGAPWEHVSHGMYGLIMVEPKGGLSKVDKEFYISQGDWYIKQGIEPYPDEDGYSLDEEKALSEHPDYIAFNGHVKALTDPQIYGDAVTVNSGDKVRVFFVAGGPNLGSSFHIIGQIFDKVYTGSPRNYIQNEETAYIPPGSAAVFEFEASDAGQFLIVDHALFRVPKGAAGYLNIN